MKHLFLLSMLAFACLAMAAEPGAVVVYTASELKAYQRKLAPRVNALKLAAQDLDNFGNHFSMIAYREASGQVEIHHHYADLFVVVSGNATLLAGGTAEGAKPVSPGEYRGGRIQGGERHRLGPGDIIHIPPKVPHLLLLEPGHKFTYFVLKVAAE